MKVAKDNGSKRCVGFPEGTCNVILDAEFIEGYSKKQGGPAREKEVREWGIKTSKWSDETDEEYLIRKEKQKGNKEIDMRGTEIWFRGDMCPECKGKYGQSKRKKKKRKLQQRQDDHELDVLKILMSELTLKESGENQDDNYSFQDQLVLDQLFRLIQKENMTLEKIGGESELLFDSADLAGLEEKIWWTVNHIYKKGKKNWNYEPNTTQLKKFLAKLEGVWCEKCMENTYNLSENICENNNCYGQDKISGKGSVNEIIRKKCVTRKRAKLKDGSGIIEDITEEHPNLEDSIKTGKGNIVWKITSSGVKRVAQNEMFNEIRNKSL